MNILDFVIRLSAAPAMGAFMVRDHSPSEAQIVSYVVSGVGFLGAGVIFKDAEAGVSSVSWAVEPETLE